MLTKTKNLILTFKAILLILMTFSTFSAESQCIIGISNLSNPSSCYASDGSFRITAVNGACGRTIRVYKNNLLLAQGTGNLTVSNQVAATFEVVAEPECGCTVPTIRTVTLFAGNPTPLSPYVNTGTGSYQADKVYVCRGGSVSLGVQPLGTSNLLLTGPGLSDSTPDGSSYWNLSNMQPAQSGNYTIKYTNPSGCESSVTIQVTVGNLSVNSGPDLAACIGTSHTLGTVVTGAGQCQQSCPSTLDSLLARWTLDQCNASDQTQQNSYTEFLPVYPSNGNCVSVSATNVYRDAGEHSCTPVFGSYTGDVGMCIPAMDSCDPLHYDPSHALKFEITVNPQEAGRITKLSFREQSPLIWFTTNGSTGPNNFNTKYLIRVYKNGLLIYSRDDVPTERTWNLETFDFTGVSGFNITEPSTFRFELRGYCVTNTGGNMSGWELDDIRIFGGCCTGLDTDTAVSYQWSNGATTPTITVNPTSSGTYTVTVTDCKGCTSTDQVNITVYPLPQATINGNLSICTGGSTFLTASGGTTYTWSTGETSSGILVNPPSTQTYTVTVSSALGCTASSSVTVVVHPLPSPVISGDLEICRGESTTLTASGGLTFEWSTGATTPSITVSPTTSTTYLVMATDQFGCQQYTEVLVVVRDLPVPSIVGDLILCLGESTTLTAAGGTNYAWSNGSSSSNITVTPASTTTYTVTVTNQYGCTSATSVTVTVHPLPVVVISGNNALCTGTSSQLTASGGVSYEWSTGASTASIMINPGLTTTYTVTVTDINGCTATGSRMATVYGLPNAQITGVKKVCQGSSATLTASGGIVFQWSTGSTNPEITVSPSVTTIYRVTVTDQNGCTGTSAHMVVANPNPTVTISGTDAFCIGGSTALTANASGTTFCEEDCRNELLLQWTFDQCNSEGLANQLDYSEFVANQISNGGLTSITATNASRNRGDHSCTFDGHGGLGICFGSLDSCDPNQYDPENALRFSVTVRPNEIGKITTLSFREQSPLNWVTTNGSTGINNYNEKYLIRVYKDGVLIFSQNDLPTERTWNTETFDFSAHPEFRVDQVSTFTFELYGYCIVDRGGTPGWELDDIKLLGGECPSSAVASNVSYLWSKGETTGTINVTPDITTTYTVTVTDCNGCSAMASKTVTVYPLPVPAIMGNNVICNGETTTLTASGGTSYSWSNGQNTASISVNPAATTTYTVTVTDANGCSAATSVTVTVNPLPTPAITGDNVICSGETTTLTASGGTSYSWSNGQNTASISVSPAATTTYSVTVTDANGCSAATSVTVTVNPLPTPSITGDNIICNGETTTLTASGGTSYSWNNGQNTASISVSPAATTTYSVTVTDANGCSAAASVTVTVNPLPTPAITGDNVICNGESTTLTASGGTSYSWSNGQNTTSISVSPAATTTYTVTVTDANGCSSASSVTVTVNPLPTPAITGDNVICYGETTTLTASGGTSYSWSNGQNTASISVSPAATTTYSVTVTDANGCSAATSVTVTVNPLPTPAITGDNVICNGESTTLTASGGTSYSWSNGQNTTSISVSPSATTTYTVTVTDVNGCSAATSVTVTVNPLPTPAITGDNVICNGETTRLYASGGTSYSWSTGGSVYWIDVNPTVTTTYSVTVTDANGCSAATSVTVTVNPLPTPAITGDNVICNGESTTLTASGGTSYSWSNGQNTSSISVSPVATTTYSVTVTDANGCSAATSVTVTVNPLPTPAITGDNVICNGETTTLTASGGTSYSWNNGQNTASISVSPAATTSYSVTVTDANGCSAATSVTVTVNPLPTPSITGDNVICNGESTTLTASGGTSYSWSNGQNTASISVSPAATTTYSVTVTDANGCSAATSVTVTVNPLPTPAITGDNIICNGESTTLTASGGTSYSWSNGQNTASISVSPAATTTYSVTVTDANGCSAATSVTVTVNPLPSPVITGDNVICNGEPTTLTASGGTSYSWSNGQNTASISVSPSATTTYSVTVTDANGCSAATSVTVTVNPLPTPAITGDNVICNGESTTLTASGGTSYSWSNGQNTASISVSPAATTTYSVTVTDANGCFAATSVTVTVNPLPSPAITGGNVICNGETTTLTASGGTSYSWSNGQNTASISVSPAATTTYTVTVTDVNGCSAATSVTVTVNPLPTPAITGDNVICNGETTTLTASGGTSYSWSNGQNTASISVSPAATTTYTVTVTDVNGCSAATSVTVTVNPLPTPAITGDNVICNGETTRLYASGGTSYSWSTGGSVYWIDVNPTVTTTYSVTVTDANGCSAATSVTVTVNPLPTPVITGDNVICNGEPTTLTASGGTSYSWSNGQNTASISVSPAATTTYSVTVTDANGCSAATSVTVTVNPLPTPAITGDKVICNGETTTLTASGGTSYSWSNGQNTTSISVSPAATTTYSVTVTDANGCSAATSVTVTVNPLPTPAITGDNVICNGESTTLTASGGTSYSWSNGQNTASISVSPAATTTYSVTVTDANGCSAAASVTVTVNPLPTPAITGDNVICNGESTTLTASGGTSYSWSNGQNTSSISVSPAATTTYSVTVTDANGCSAAASVTVTVNPLPTPAITGDNVICNGESTTLTASGGTSYSWSNGQNTTSISVSPAATTTYSVTVTDANGCSAATSVTVTVNPLPTPAITGDNVICNGESTTLTASGGTSYSWSNGQNTASISVSPAATATYFVTVTDANGCSAATSVTVTVNALPVVTISGDDVICQDECTTLTASGGMQYEWSGVSAGGYSCSGAFYVGGPQGGGNQNLYTISAPSSLNIVGSIGANLVNGIAYYCQGNNSPFIYAMKMKGTPQTTAVQADLVRIDPVTAQLTVLGTIPQPPNPYGTAGITGIMAYIGDASTSGIYYFPAVATIINPVTFQIIDYTIYMGAIDLNNHGNGANVTYTPISVLATCKPYMDACIQAFQTFTANPGSAEPSGGIQDWALSPDGQTMYSFFGIENALFRLDLASMTTNCVPAPASNTAFTGQTGAMTDEFGGVYFSGNTLYGLQVDRGRLFSINQSTGALTLVSDALPADFRGDNASCTDCGSTGIEPLNFEQITVCPDLTTTYSVKVTDANGCMSTASVTVTVNPLPTPTITGDNVICNGESTTLTASGGISYTWSNGQNTASISVTPATTTTYQVTATDTNGCKGTASVTVTVNPLPTPSILGNTTICQGQSTSLFASGGTSYQWSNGFNTAFINISPVSTTTYSVTVTDANGCSAATSVTVTVNPLPTPAITGDNVICNGESTTLTASGGTSYSWSNGQNTASISVSPTATTTYSVTVTDANGCSAATSVTVTVNPLPTPSITGDNVICNGETTTLTASGGTSYSWSNGQNTASISVGPAATTSYSVTVTDVNGCSAATSVTVTVNPLPTPSITGDNVICNGETTTLTASGGTSYSWSNGQNTSSISVSPAATTTYSVTVTDANGCSAATSVTVTVNPLPTPAITGDNVICNGESSTLTASGGTSYSWSNGQNTASISVSPTATTTYSVTVTGANGCSAATSVTVTVNPLPTPAITGDNVICNGESTTLIASGGTSYSWSNGQNTTSISVSPAATTTYSVTVTDANGCSAATSVTVTVNPLPSPSITGDNIICNGESTTLTASSGTSYSWSNGQNTASISVSPAATTTYSVTVTDANGCSTATSVTVTVNPLPTPAITGDNVICNGETTRLYSSGGTSYSWSTGGSVYWIDVNPTVTTTYSVTVTDANGCSAATSVTVTVNSLPTPSITGDNVICNGESTTLTASGGTSYSWSNGQNTASISVSPTATTTYSVTVTDANGCSAATSVTVTVNPLPTPAITGDNVICNGELTTLTASGGTSYSWSNGQNTTSISVSPAATTTYSVTVTDANGCSAATSVTVTVNPLPTPAITGDNVICNGKTTTLTASGGTSYSWINGQNTASISVSPTATTTYSVTVTDANGCSAATSVTVTVNPLPTPAITGDNVICNGETTTLTASGGTSYSWSNGQNTASISVSPTATTTYSVTVTDANRCSAATSVIVTVNPLPTPAITGDNVICNGELTTLTASGGTSYSWSSGQNTASISVSPAATTTYSVTVTDANGCSAATSVAVTVNPLPTPVITGNTSICNGSQTILTATGGGTYLWSNGAATSVITVAPQTSATYTVTVTNANSCTASATATVMVKPKPTLHFSGIENICKGDSAVIVVTGSTPNTCPGVCNVTNNSTLSYWDLNACQSFMSNGSHVNYSEFLPVVANGNCLGVSAGTVHRLPNNKHSCTPGPNGSIGMCIPSQDHCAASKLDYSQALRFQITLNPAQTGQITGLEFYEQAPENFQFVSGPTGPNNYATKFLVRVSKNGEFIYYEDNIATNRTWGLQSFDFSSNNNFKTLAAATYLFELIPYCRINNGAAESVWDVDEIRVLGGCCQGNTNEISSYQWSNGDTGTSITVRPTQNTTYTVTVTDCCGCTHTGTFDVKVGCLVADLGPDKMINLGESITLTPTVTGASNCNGAGGSNVSYKWSNGETTASITVTPISSTFYRLTVTDCNECVDVESISIHIMMNRPITTYPNPATERINIASEMDLDPAILKVRLYSADGKKVLSDHPQLDVVNLRNISVVIPPHLTSGVYLLEIDTGERRFTEKVILLK